MTLFLCRHGQTEWTKTGQHTSFTDIPLTEEGKWQAKQMKPFFEHIPFISAVTSPHIRAKQTSELAGFQAIVDADLVEWNYGDYEGLTSAEIKRVAPNWNLFSEGAPKGESLEQVCLRADRLLKKLSLQSGPIVIFSHGHFSRVLAARFLNLTPSTASIFYLDPASISHLGYEHDRPVVKLWNSTTHLSQHPV